MTGVVAPGQPLKVARRLSGGPKPTGVPSVVLLESGGMPALKRLVAPLEALVTTSVQPAAEIAAEAGLLPVVGVAIPWCVPRPSTVAVLEPVLVTKAR